ncbi:MULTISPECIES: T9SS type A sorting domain-containing protein [Chryseobacterium]|uniref:T9SS type A sorting domain-containing protein n=1 Tax=Chryseobacterium TaxID=59732 RepID=UPI0009D7D009|nr:MULTISPECIES: T9SS type A sorting domain-containing protein [Chryseobacterium]MDC8098676.1 T9SS type A sorting domain-containing protein [Chryseobacterium rhizosphaerae]SMC50574.1 Por secretion system C-terminal sorting domain-containing protein [Chryseobacterium sp. YR221]
MKKIFTILGIASAIGFMNAQTTVLTEDFSFTGALNANGWVTHSGTAGQLTSNGNAVNLISGNSEDVNKAFSSVYNISSTEVSRAEYSATINVPNGTGLSTTAGDYFLMFTVSSGANPGIFNGRLFAKGSATGYTLGVLNNGAGGSATPTFGTEIPYGTPANITLAYIVDNTGGSSSNTATLQINSQPLITSTAGTGSAPATIGAVAIRQGSGTGNISIDNLVAKVYSPTLAVSEFKNGKSGSFVKNSFVKNGEITFGADVKDVKVFNMYGQVVKTASVKQNGAVNVAELTKGNYIVTGTVNNQPVSQKILKD